MNNNYIQYTVYNYDMLMSLRTVYTCTVYLKNPSDALLF